MQIEWFRRLGALVFAGVMLDSICQEHAFGTVPSNGEVLLEICDRADRTSCKLIISGFVDGLEYAQSSTSVAGDPRKAFAFCITRGFDEQASALVEWLKAHPEEWTSPNGDLLFTGACLNH